MTLQNAKKPQLAVMNAVHDLPVLVARDKGFFKDEDLDIDFVTTPGMAQVTTSHVVKFDSIFDRPLDSVYNDGGIDQYRMCEWGIMKRAVEAETTGLRGRKIVALGASMSSFAIVVNKDSKAYEPEQLKDQAIAVTPNNGSHFTTLKMMEGFLAPEHIKTTHAGSMPKRIEALRKGEVAAVSLMEPWISYAQKLGLRILIESHSTRGEAANSTARRWRRCSVRKRARSKSWNAIRRPTPIISPTRPADCCSRTSCRPGGSSTRRRSPTRASGSTTLIIGR
jgi:NitT/TauT family transport system substrate-binding protein